MSEPRDELWQGPGKPDPRLELPPDWDKVCLWDGKLSVQFGYAKHGWVLMGLIATGYNQSLVLHLSNTFDPFEKLLEWLGAIAEGKLPATLRIDEEGVEKELIVSAYTGNYRAYSDIEFRVIGTVWDGEAKRDVWRRLLLVRLKREQLLNEFCGRFERWLAEDYVVEDWHPTAKEDFPDETWWDLRNLDVPGLKQKIARLGP
jgi:hypothetical protein